MTLLELLVILGGLLFGAGATAWLIRTYDVRRVNFRGRRIPAIAGLVFVLGAEFVYAYEWWSLRDAVSAAYFLVTLGFGVLGLADDLLGDRSVGGFRGHLGALRRGRLTTGAAKVVGGGFVSLVAGFLLAYPFPVKILLAALLIALSANTLNLLDLRPGRCLFGFFVGIAILLGTLVWHQAASAGFLLYVAVAFAVVLYPLDAAGRVMLGDTGANAFGAVLGVGGALFFSPLWQALVVAALVLFQIWGERNSLSQTIERSRFLRSLDRKIGIR